MKQTGTNEPARGGDDTGIEQRDLLSLIGYNMKRAYMLFYQDLKLHLAEYDLRQRTFSVLSLVIENPNISQIEIARTLGIERSGTVVIVDELEDRGLVVRSKVPGDRRAYALTATEAGQDLYRKALKKIADHEERLLSDLSESEKMQLLSLLSRIHMVDTGGQADEN